MKNSHRIRNSYRRATLPLILVLLCAAALVPDTVQTQDKKDKETAQDPEQKMPFGEEDLKEKKVEGKYKFSAIPDLKQISDPTALATINRVNMSLGRGRYAGLVKIATVGVENRNHQALKSLRLRWRMVSADEPQEVLLEGSTPFFATTINPQDSKVIEIPHIFYNRVVKPLLKDNELHGNYHLVISVSNARFEDGTAFVPKAVHTQENKDKKRVVFDDDDLKVEKVRGKGMVSTLPDIRQAGDYSVPVIVTYVNTFFGHGKYAGRLKVLEAKIENRSNKPTQAIQLRWTIVSRENPEAVLLEGVVSFLEVQIEPQTTLLTDIPPIYFNKIAKPLLKDGVLDDNVLVMVGVQEVRFADGSTWQQPRQAAFLN